VKKKNPKKSKGKAKIEILDDKIGKLQKASKTIYPSLSKLHTDLCKKSPIYYEWHKNPSAESVHWMVITLVTLYLIYINGRILFSLAGG